LPEVQKLWTSYVAVKFGQSWSNLLKKYNFKMYILAELQLLVK